MILGHIRFAVNYICVPFFGVFNLLAFFFFDQKIFNFVIGSGLLLFFAFVVLPSGRKNRKS